MAWRWLLLLLMLAAGDWPAVSLKVKTTDRYRRTVAEVIREIKLNLAMVEDGQAIAYRQVLGSGRWREGSPGTGS
jgi:endonuclease YncB( thermonuclease family)